MADLATQYKGKGYTNGDIICMLGVAESTFYRWTCHPRSNLQRTLLKGLIVRSQFRRTMITAIGNAALASHRNWTAAAWLLERKHPNEFAQITRKTGEYRRRLGVLDDMANTDLTLAVRLALSCASRWRRAIPGPPGSSSSSVRAGAQVDDRQRADREGQAALATAPRSSAAERDT